MINILRMLDKGPPPYPDCIVVLVDALRDFIRADEMERRDLLLQGSITAAQAKDGGGAFRPRDEAACRNRAMGSRQ